MAPFCENPRDTGVLTSRLPKSASQTWATPFGRRAPISSPRSFRAGAMTGARRCRSDGLASRDDDRPIRERTVERAGGEVTRLLTAREHARLCWSSDPRVSERSIWQRLAPAPPPSTSLDGPPDISRLPARTRVSLMAITGFAHCATRRERPDYRCSPRPVQSGTWDCRSSPESVALQGGFPSGRRISVGRYIRDGSGKCSPVTGLRGARLR